jgi:hypothetical protein
MTPQKGGRAEEKVRGRKRKEGRGKEDKSEDEEREGGKG